MSPKVDFQPSLRDFAHLTAHYPALRAGLTSIVAARLSIVREFLLNSGGREIPLDKTVIYMIFIVYR